MDGRVDRYLSIHRERHLNELSEFLRIPSVSTLPEYKYAVREAAEWIAQQLREAGITNAALMETDGHPVVYGEWLKAPGAPTVLIYGHYDVQPPDPIEKWDSPPFVPSFRDGRIYARGVSDDKAPSFIAIKSVEALMAVDGTLPVNVKFLFEGEEEVGSPNLPLFVERYADMLTCDLVVSADGAMWRPTEPSITVASRGMAKLQVSVTTAGTDLHSGRHGGAVPNALHALAELIAGLHDSRGRVTVPGFYDQVRPLTEAERHMIASLGFDEDAYRTDLGISELVGEEGYSTLERVWARPTLEVNGMWGGFTGEGSKTVVPAEAHAKITCRLVADQDPQTVMDRVEAHLLGSVPRGARVTVKPYQGSALPYQMPSDLPVLKTAGLVLTEIMGREPVYVRMGGTLPAAEIFQATLGAYTLFLSFSTADELFHAPNEFFRIERLDAGLRVWATLWQRVGAGASEHGRNGGEDQ